MRYFLVHWLGERPRDDEVVHHLKRFLGEADFLASGFRIFDGTLACENRWLQKIRGALALRWQFRVTKVGSTKKSVSEQSPDAPH